MNKTTIRIEGSGPTWKLTSKSGTVTAGQQGSLWHMMVVAQENFSTWPERKRDGMWPFVVLGKNTIAYAVRYERQHKHMGWVKYSPWPERLHIPADAPRLP